MGVRYTGKLFSSLKSMPDSSCKLPKLKASLAIPTTGTPLKVFLSYRILGNTKERVERKKKEKKWDVKLVATPVMKVVTQLSNTGDILDATVAGICFSIVCKGGGTGRPESD